MPTISSFALRKPEPRDGSEIYGLVERCKPLDVNSRYAYMLVSYHFRDTSVVAESSDGIVGFISGYLPPTSPDALFIWQVAVDPQARRHGLAKTMLREILSRQNLHRIVFLETTVTPTNLASATLFRSLASDFGAGCHESELFSSNLFADEGHESEVLFRIGPFRHRPEADMGE